MTPDPITKAITDTVANTAANQTAQTKAMTGSAFASTLTKTLTPKEAYSLNVHVRKSIDSNASQCSKCKLVMYSRTSDAVIEDGELWRLMRRPMPGVSLQSYVYQCISWFDISGEFNVFAVPEKGARPSKLIPLDTDKVAVKPYHARNPEQVVAYEFRDPLFMEGVVSSFASLEIPPQYMVRAHNFNPSDAVRGLSPVLSGQHEISTNYFVNRYNASYFQNGASADVIVRFPKGTSHKVAEEWCERWQANHGIYNNNGFKISAIIGDDMQIETPNATANEGKFLELQTLNAETISAIWGVPPSVMGFLSRTRFDTIDVELESYAENTLMPRIEMWNQTHQTQLVDRWFRTSSGNVKSITKGFRHLKKNCRLGLEKALDESPQSEIIMMLDPDSLPIMSKLLMNKVKAAKEMADSLFTSRREAAEYVGIELEDNPVRENIYIPNTYQLATAEQPKAPEPIAPQPEPEEDEPTGDEVAAVKAFYRGIRKQVLEAAEKGELHDKRLVLGHVEPLPLTDAQKHNLTVQCHEDFVIISRLKGDKDAIKKHLNDRAKTSSVKALLKE